MRLWPGFWTEHYINGELKPYSIWPQPQLACSSIYCTSKCQCMSLKQVFNTLLYIHTFFRNCSDLLHLFQNSFSSSNIYCTSIYCGGCGFLDGRGGEGSGGEGGGSQGEEDGFMDLCVCVCVF